MNQRVLSLSDEWASYSDTVSLKAGQAIKILEIVPPRKSAFVILNNPAIRMKLRDAAGNELSADTKICFAGKSSKEMLATQLSAEKEYRAYREITESDQYNEKYQEALTFPVENDLLFEELEKFEVFVEVSSDITLDLTKSKIEIPAVELTTSEVQEMDLLGADYEVDIPEEYEDYEEY
ncbi:hypothetical protein [Marinitoga lauensis]|uniref:hypothetical protein n=1 Tax=Marinitoga lauensis TaxID=2201189 RepID=UPI001011BE08|nr:hypothetical protein [Marinitoga lauensis]